VSITSKRLIGLRRVAVTFEQAIGILILALITVGTTVVDRSGVTGYLAMSLMFLGTVLEFAGVAMITSQAIQGDTAAKYAATHLGASPEREHAPHRDYCPPKSPANAPTPRLYFRKRSLEMEPPYGIEP
jgi:hypothetical protein